MPEHTISFSKIVPTPTDLRWSQIYTAGSLFAVLALTRKQGADADLKSVGKDILNNLEAEFFTLEEKSLAAIKDASQKALATLPETVLISFCLGFIKDRVLYLVIAGSGQVLIKRGEKAGVVLKKAPTVTEAEPELTLESASGKLTHNDLVLLESSSFAQTVTPEILRDALTNILPTDIAETLSPHVHTGDAAAIILSYKESAPHPMQSDVPDAKEEEAAPDERIAPVSRVHETESSEDGQSSPAHPVTARKKRMPLPSFSLPTLPHRKKMLLSIALLLALILIASIFFTIQKRNDEENQRLFAEIYTSAQQDYEEGVSLLGLNKTLARDDLLKAKQTLSDGKDRFKSGSEEAEKIAALEKQIDEKLKESSGENSVNAVGIDMNEHPLLAAVNDDEAVLASILYEEQVYTLTDEAVHTVEDGDASVLYENDADWSDAAGLGVFGSNFYVLDTEEGVLKFTPSGDTYIKSNYFTGSPNVENAVSMAIDGSVWILLEDGEIQKFTRGKADSFAVSGLETPLSSPTKIVTGEELDALYVLDRGNQRIVKLNKDGKYASQFASGVLQNARDMSISSDEKTAFVLSDGKAYSLALN